ncbi:MAG: CPBP family intramembrane metalloprotease domain-containing protein [Spirochaetae bacterium HGW-Spirochaetae-5]|nr:MAG: CPBP family intramembrane metalloprotease domain-containing protein [Spirochaetae bacterium HGW-Spirochaetae-5]
MNINKYRHLFLFYFLATVIPWVLWFTAAYLSHITPAKNSYAVAGGILGIIGLTCPMIIAFCMMMPDPDLRRDLFQRIFNISRVKPFYLMVTCLLMLSSILIAQAISLLFGFSTDQFKLADGFSFSYALFPAWSMLILAPLMEELAWHSYGTDCLRARFNLFTTSVIFAVYWALWHFPLSFIKDYYHSNLVEIGWVYSLNFYFSIIPFVLIMNWLYYKTERNILIVIVFHISAGFFNEIFLTHPISKVIQTVLLIALSIILVIRERDFFFRQDYTEFPDYQK